MGNNTNNTDKKTIILIRRISVNYTIKLKYKLYLNKQGLYLNKYKPYLNKQGLYFIFSIWLTIFCKPVLNKLLLLWREAQLVFRLYRNLTLVEL